MPNRPIVSSLVVGLTGLLCGCATPDNAPDSEVAQHVQRCDFDETWSCVERMGHRARCFCADKDTLRELLEPTMR